jgi:Ca2+-binding RTX toxin-like protein
MALKFGTDGNDWLTGSNDADDLFGYDGIDFLFGNGGADALHGGAGNDWLYGGAGNDYLWGQQGNDYIEGGAGADSIWGGMGNEFGHSDSDTAGYLGSPAGVFVSLGVYGIKGAWWGDAEGDQLYNIENLWGSKFNDVLWGDDYGNGLKGYQGNDILRGWAGVDSIEGGDGHDELYGGAGIDTLNGGSGNDRLEGGEGDTMSGGSGADTFVWMYTAESDGTSWNTDFINDFNRAEGDLMDLSAIDANANGTWDVFAAGNQAFSFIGNADHPFTAPGQISFAHVAGTYTHILLNTDDDAEAEGTISVYGVHAVDAGWFVL